MNDYVLISIKTEHANKIFSGQKKYELRRKSIGEKNLNRRIYVYSSKDDKVIIGYIIINRILEGNLDYILNVTGYASNAGAKDYFDNLKTCFALEIKEYYKFSVPITLDEIRKYDNTFTAPQFFKYIKPDSSIYRLLEKRQLEKTYNMKLQPAFFDMIRLEKKRIELRLNDEKRKKIKIGDIIIFEDIKDNYRTLKVKVIDLYHAPNFKELISNLDILEIANKKYTKREVIKELTKIYPIEEQNTFGTIAIRFEIIKD